MPSFSKTSADRLATCHQKLQDVFNEVIRTHDCMVLCGHRTKTEQEQAFSAKPPRSKVHFPNSRHNSLPSHAVDVIPWPFKPEDWSDRERMAEFAAVVLAVAKHQGVKMRWGGDWNGNKDWRDEKFLDMPHFELIGEG